jgi:hypothetical protein
MAIVTGLVAGPGWELRMRAPRGGKFDRSPARLRYRKGGCGLAPVVGPARGLAGPSVIAGELLCQVCDRQHAVITGFHVR